ncbi:uncharacterized protein LOC6607473 [Drosophila sechellia]|uniref:GM26457 n=1 Tax=Drosophila sechellia TaxID=7238 RepID=B4HER7_DROSE|nr:uncharacterized protein LOC6607473 [Drosophila sechellia]EDW43228.1 GM26457 [Drosophila sechellia]
MCQRAVRDWLVLLTMEKYIDIFMDRGYDCIERCKLIIVSDLIMLGVDNPAHRKLLLEGVRFLNNAPEQFNCMESCELHQEIELKLDPDVELFASLKFLENVDFLKAPYSLTSPQKTLKTRDSCKWNVNGVDQLPSKNLFD